MEIKLWMKDCTIENIWLHFKCNVAKEDAQETLINSDFLAAIFMVLSNFFFADSATYIFFLNHRHAD